tara:strand:- start:394 stop:987 length:594 start_codon:yes stop_codon:yes gene_type:complete
MPNPLSLSYLNGLMTQDSFEMTLVTNFVNSNSGGYQADWTLTPVVPFMTDASELCFKPFVNELTQGEIDSFLGTSGEFSADAFNTAWSWPGHNNFGMLVKMNKVAGYVFSSNIIAGSTVAADTNPCETSAIQKRVTTLTAHTGIPYASALSNEVCLGSEGNIALKCQMDYQHGGTTEFNDILEGTIITRIQWYPVSL